jgi:hypothetical protein
MARRSGTEGKKLPHTRLAEGEVTGHYHEAVGAGVALYETADGDRFLSAPGGAEIIHQEHRVVTLPPGDFDRLIVQEYDHFAEESRAVVD